MPDVEVEMANISQAGSMDIKLPANERALKRSTKSIPLFIIGGITLLIGIVLWAFSDPPVSGTDEPLVWITTDFDSGVLTFDLSQNNVIFYNSNTTTADCSDLFDDLVCTDVNDNDCTLAFHSQCTDNVDYDLDQHYIDEYVLVASIDETLVSGTIEIQCIDNAATVPTTCDTTFGTYDTTADDVEFEGFGTLNWVAVVLWVVTFFLCQGALLHACGCCR